MTPVRQGHPQSRLSAVPTRVMTTLTTTARMTTPQERTTL
ncbi:hypothetical protein ABID80_002094 [Streptomyces sp. PvP037]